MVKPERLHGEPPDEPCPLEAECPALAEAEARLEKQKRHYEDWIMDLGAMREKEAAKLQSVEARLKDGQCNIDPYPYCTELADLKARLAAAENCLQIRATLHAGYLDKISEQADRIASLEEIARTAERWCYDCSGGGTRREVLEKLREARKP
jgi:hypothetical protein